VSAPAAAAVFVPGGVMPAGLAYGPLLDVLGDAVRPIVKDLEVYATDRPPLGYGLDLEVRGIARVADAAGAARFHLVGYSGGGAAAVAFAAALPERLLSLALIEPAWIGAAGATAEDAADFAELDRLMLLPAAERMRSFMRWQMRPGVDPPALPLPPGPPPAWMALRPAGLEALARSFRSYPLDRSGFARFARPVYYALGSLSRPYFERTARRLANEFPDIRVDIYVGRSHLDPPHRAEPQRFADALVALWERGADPGVP
jgi:pimeloyl-ACP methyl ester carboxylesterase